MLIKKSLVHCTVPISDAVFFDIETTGLYWKHSHLYLIGAAAQKDVDCWELIQWFAEKPRDEEALLRSFFDYLDRCTKIIHFNGSSFDIPYLKNKSAFYGLKNPFCNLESLDLYRILQPLKKLYEFGSFSQKEAEKLTSFQRTDTYSGKELISAYQGYLLNGNPALSDILFCHNFDDVQGMLHLYKLFPLADKEQLLPQLLTAARTDKGQISLHFSLPLPLPRPFFLRKNGIVLSVNHSEGKLVLTVLYGNLKHFYPDYKNYYYLPLEDEAIHKSVALCVDREYRQRATAANCYKKMTGEFLPVVYPTDSILLWNPDGSRENYMLWKDALLCDHTFLNEYLVNTFRILIP